MDNTKQTDIKKRTKPPSSGSNKPQTTTHEKLKKRKKRDESNPKKTMKRDEEIMEQEGSMEVEYVENSSLKTQQNPSTNSKTHTSLPLLEDKSISGIMLSVNRKEVNEEENRDEIIPSNPDIHHRKEEDVVFEEVENPAVPDENQDAEDPQGVNSEDKSQEVNPMEPNEVKYTEYYLDDYCLRNDGKEQYYARDSSDNPIYLQNSSGELRYAWKTILVDGEEQRVEYPATGKDDQPIYIIEKGIPKYPENLTTNQIIFPTNPNTNEEFYLKGEGQRLVYPTNSQGKQFYRRNLEGKEVPITHVHYANENGTEIYPKDKNKDDYYLKDPENKRRDKAAKKSSGKKYYAKKANNDEYYPREPIIGENEYESDDDEWINIQ